MAKMKKLEERIEYMRKYLPFLKYLIKKEPDVAKKIKYSEMHDWVDKGNVKGENRKRVSLGNYQTLEGILNAKYRALLLIDEEIPHDAKSCFEIQTVDLISDDEEEQQQKKEQQKDQKEKRNKDLEEESKKTQEKDQANQKSKKEAQKQQEQQEDKQAKKQECENENALFQRRKKISAEEPIVIDLSSDDEETPLKETSICHSIQSIDSSIGEQTVETELGKSKAIETPLEDASIAELEAQLQLLSKSSGIDIADLQNLIIEINDDLPQVSTNTSPRITHPENSSANSINANQTSPYVPQPVNVLPLPHHQIINPPPQPFSMIQPQMIDQPPQSHMIIQPKIVHTYPVPTATQPTQPTLKYNLNDPRLQRRICDLNTSGKTGDQRSKALMALGEYFSSVVAKATSKLPVAHNQIPVAHNQIPVAHNQIPVGHNQIPVAHNQIPVAHKQTPASQTYGDYRRQKLEIEKRKEAEIAREAERQKQQLHKPVIQVKKTSKAQTSATSTTKTSDIQTTKPSDTQTTNTLDTQTFQVLMNTLGPHTKEIVQRLGEDGKRSKNRKLLEEKQSKDTEESPDVDKIAKTLKTLDVTFKGFDMVNNLIMQRTTKRRSSVSAKVAIAEMAQGNFQKQKSNDTRSPSPVQKRRKSVAKQSGKESEKTSATPTTSRSKRRKTMNEEDISNEKSNRELTSQSGKESKKTRTTPTTSISKRRKTMSKEDSSNAKKQISQSEKVKQNEKATEFNKSNEVAENRPCKVKVKRRKTQASLARLPQDDSKTKTPKKRRQTTHGAPIDREFEGQSKILKDLEVTMKGYNVNTSLQFTHRSKRSASIHASEAITKMFTSTMDLTQSEEAPTDSNYVMYEQTTSQPPRITDNNKDTKQVNEPSMSHHLPRIADKFQHSKHVSPSSYGADNKQSTVEETPKMFVVKNSFSMTHSEKVASNNNDAINEPTLESLMYDSTLKEFARAHPDPKLLLSSTVSLVRLTDKEIDMLSSAIRKPVILNKSRRPTIYSDIIKKNVDRYSFWNEKQCVLCSCKSDDLTNHYVNRHKTESYVSRLSSTQLNWLSNHVPCAEIPCEETFDGTFEIRCIFCNEMVEDHFNMFHNHFSLHTGEYAFECSICHLRKPYEDNINEHISKSKNCNGAKTVTLYSYFGSQKQIEIYACTECNYVQMNRENIRKHLETQHFKPGKHNIKQYIAASIKFEEEKIKSEIVEDNVEVMNEPLMDVDERLFQFYDHLFLPRSPSPSLPMVMIPMSPTQELNMDISLTDVKPDIGEINLNLTADLQPSVSGCIARSTYKMNPQNEFIIPLYKCMGKDCLYTSKYSKKFMDHLNDYKTKSEEHIGLFECAYCHWNDTGICNSPKALVEHIEENHGHSTFQCTVCFYRSCEIDNVSLHTKLNHKGVALSETFVIENEKKVDGDMKLKRISCAKAKNMKKISCECCSKDFYALSSLSEHMKSMHGKQPCTNDIKRYQCIYCAEEFDYTLDAKVHMAQNHPDEWAYVCERKLKDVNKDDKVDNLIEIALYGLQKNLPDSSLRRTETSTATVKENCSSQLSESTAPTSRLPINTVPSMEITPATSFSRSELGISETLPTRVTTQNHHENATTPGISTELHKILTNTSESETQSADNQTIEIPDTELLEAKPSSEERLNILTASLGVKLEVLLWSTGVSVHKLYTCTQSNCSSTFSTGKLLSEHMLRRHRTALSKCAHCVDSSEEYGSGRELEKHIEQHRQHMCLCFHCDATFVNQSIGQEHMKTNHPEITAYHTETIVGVFKLLIDSSLYGSNKEELYNALIQQADERKKRQDEKFEQSLVSTWLEEFDSSNLLWDEQPFRSCLFLPCKFETKFNQEMYAHWRSTHISIAPRSFNCKCKQAFMVDKNSFDMLTAHLDTHSMSLYKCLTCKHIVRFPASASYHIRTKHKYTDNFTLYTETARNELKFQIYITFAEGELTFSTIKQCFCCGESNLQPDKLIKHLRLKHDIYLEYRCDTCPMVFKNLAIVRRHFVDKHPKKTLRIVAYLKSQYKVSVDALEPTLRISVKKQKAFAVPTWEEHNVIKERDEDSDVELLEDDDVEIEQSLIERKKKEETQEKPKPTIKLKSFAYLFEEQPSTSQNIRTQLEENQQQQKQQQENIIQNPTGGCGAVAATLDMTSEQNSYSQNHHNLQTTTNVNQNVVVTLANAYTPSTTVERVNQGSRPLNNSTAFQQSLPTNRQTLAGNLSQVENRQTSLASNSFVINDFTITALNVNKANNPTSNTTVSRNMSSTGNNNLNNSSINNNSISNNNSNSNDNRNNINSNTNYNNFSSNSNSNNNNLNNNINSDNNMNIYHASINNNNNSNIKDNRNNINSNTNHNNLNSYSKTTNLNNNINNDNNNNNINNTSINNNNNYNNNRNNLNSNTNHNNINSYSKTTNLNNNNINSNSNMTNYNTSNSHSRNSSNKNNYNNNNTNNINNNTTQNNLNSYNNINNYNHKNSTLNNHQSVQRNVNSIINQPQLSNPVMTNVRYPLLTQQQAELYEAPVQIPAQTALLSAPYPQLQQPQTVYTPRGHTFNATQNVVHHYPQSVTTQMQQPRSHSAYQQNQSPYFSSVNGFTASSQRPQQFNQHYIPQTSSISTPSISPASSITSQSQPHLRLNMTYSPLPDGRSNTEQSSNSSCLQQLLNYRSK